MLCAVVERELRGQKSIVVAGNAAHMRRLVQAFNVLLVPHGHTNKGTVFAQPSAGLDWPTLRVDGIHEDQRVFVDHFTIEMHLSNVLDELHRYDPPETMSRQPYDQIVLGKFPSGDGT